MPEYTSVQRDYARYRLEKSREDLEAARLLFNNGNYRVANNRAYYAIFHAMPLIMMICLLQVEMRRRCRLKMRNAFIG